MKTYVTPRIELEAIEAEDIILVSGEGEKGETPFLPANTTSQASTYSARGTIAGGSTVSNIAGSGASNAFSAGDIFGLR